jgi:single-strand DNA-binding protein
MRSINTITLSGMLGTDPEYRFFQTGTEMMTARFCWAGWGKDDAGKVKFHWIDLKLFKPSEGLKPYLHNKTKIAITGRLEIDTWDDKNGGGKRSRPVIIVTDLVLIGGKDEGEHQVPLVPKTQGTPGTIPLEGSPETPF